MPLRPRDRLSMSIVSNAVTGASETRSNRKPAVKAPARHRAIAPASSRAGSASVSSASPRSSPWKQAKPDGGCTPRATGSTASTAGTRPARGLRRATGGRPSEPSRPRPWLPPERGPLPGTPRARRAVAGGCGVTGSASPRAGPSRRSGPLAAIPRLGLPASKALPGRPSPPRHRRRGRGSGAGGTFSGASTFSLDR